MWVSWWFRTVNHLPAGTVGDVVNPELGRSLEQGLEILMDSASLVATVHKATKS